MAAPRKITTLHAEVWSVVTVDHVTEIVADGERRSAEPSGASRGAVANADVLLTPDWEVRVDAV